MRLKRKKDSYKFKINRLGTQYITTDLIGDELLNTPQLNKGTAFTKEERKRFNLLGKLPSRIESLKEQLERVYTQFNRYKDINQKRLFLNELYNINQVLFYKFCLNNLEELTPIIYTPYVATACQNFSDEFCRPYGIYISYPDQAHMEKILDSLPHSEIDLVVVTDGQRILGIGDQGVGGIGIPIGKLILYTLLGGINPLKTLPIVLDVGTNNKNLLQNPRYLGWRHQRITGKKYSHFIDKFIFSLKKKNPNVLVQWEDFGKENAAVILERYRKTICSFNDDIQGTAVVTLAAILAAIRSSKQELAKQRIVILGAGSAAIGIADLIVFGMQREEVTKEAAQKRVWLLNRKGLITNYSKEITPNQKLYLHKLEEIKDWKVENRNKISLLEVVKNVKPTILIGCSTAANSFTKEIVTAMAKHVANPIILPLSNPTANSEATPKDLIKWTNGQALIATGSPFDPVIYKNKKHVIAQCNNALAFPGIGLGIIASKAREVTDKMLWAAVKTIYKKSTIPKKPTDSFLPLLKDAADISKEIGKQVAKTVLKNGNSSFPSNSDVNKLITQTLWKAEYKKLVLD